MEKNNIKHDIIDLLEIIVEQAEIINHYKHEIPQIELDILMENTAFGVGGVLTNDK